MSKRFLRMAQYFTGSGLNRQSPQRPKIPPYYADADNRLLVFKDLKFLGIEKRIAWISPKEITDKTLLSIYVCVFDIAWCG